MDSAMLVLEDEWSDGERRHSSGPLAGALDAMTSEELTHLSSVLEPLTSCYTAGEATGRSVTASKTLRDVGARSLVALPITARGRRTGLLLLTDAHPVPLGPEQVEPLELLAVLAGSCLETATTVEELRRQARRDALTGIGNHSSFHERLRDLALQEHVTLLVLDIDNFKQVNDSGGHLLGDQVLRSTTDELRHSVPDEAVFRIGGDEFAVILHARHAAPHAARAVERKIQRSVGPMLAEHGAALSVGLAHRRTDEALIDTLERADAQLYLAKAAKPRMTGATARGTDTRSADTHPVAGRL